jgi:hypothetical protein
MALEDKELLTNFTTDEAIANAIHEHLRDEKLPCAAAFRIAEAQDVTPLEVGKTADQLEIHLTRCQLGLFGYPQGKGWRTALPEIANPEALKSAIEARLNEKGELPCRAAWEIAEAHGLPRMHVGYLADKLGIRLTTCQMGAF